MSNTSSRPRIVIDPGHGDRDPGTNGGGYLEKDLALKYSLMLGHFFREKGYEVVFTRSEDITITNEYRRTVASKGDILLSCHLNGAESKTAHGLSIWYRSGIAESKEIATAVYDSIAELGYFQRYSTGVLGDKTRYDTGFYMLRYAERRGCKHCMICEPGFLTNDKDRAVLTDETKRNKLAKAICEGVDSYVKAHWK